MTRSPEHAQRLRANPLCCGGRRMDMVWTVYNWIDDLAGPYGGAIVVSGAIIGAIYWVLSASR